MQNMGGKNVKKYLEQLKADGRYDADFLDTLIASNINDDDWLVTVSKLSEIIDRRYAESKKDKT